MEPWLKAVAAFHQSVMRFLQLGYFVRSGRVLWRNLEVAGGSWRYQQRENRKCSPCKSRKFILLQRNHRALVGNLALSARISYVWGFPEITVIL